MKRGRSGALSRAFFQSSRKRSAYASAMVPTFEGIVGHAANLWANPVHEILGDVASASKATAHALLRSTASAARAWMHRPPSGFRKRARSSGAGVRPPHHTAHRAYRGRRRRMWSPGWQYWYHGTPYVYVHGVKENI